MGIPNYYAAFAGQYEFIQIGGITSTEPALAVDERDNASVVALASTKTVIWHPDDGTVAALLRFRTDGNDGDDVVVQMYAAKGADYYTRVATLTMQQGTQDWSSGHFIDTITLSNEQWDLGIRVQNTTDEIGRVYFNTGGFDRFLFIAPTKAPTTLYVDICRLDQEVKGDVYSALITMTGGIDLSDVVSANLNTKGAVDLVTTEVSDASSNLKSALSGYISDVVEGITLMDSAQSGMFSTLEQAVDDVTTAVDTVANNTDSAVDAIDQVRSGILSVATETHSILHSVLDDTSALVDTTTTIANNTDSAVDAIDQVRSGILSVATETHSILHSVLDDTSAIVVNTGAANNHLDSAVDAIDELKGAIVALDSAQSGMFSTLQTEVSDAISNLKAAVTYASVWAETHSFVFSSTMSNQQTSALTINGVCQKIVVEVGSNATVVGTADVAITDNEGVEIFAADALAEASNFVYNVQEPLTGTITVGVTPGADPGQAWSVVVTMRGV